MEEQENNKLKKIYSIGLLLSLIVTATLVTSLANYTTEHGFILHEKYAIPSIILVLVTVVMIYFYKNFQQKTHKN